jgi:hypothetical protein
VTLTEATGQTLWFQVLAFGVAGALSLLLPRRAPAHADEPAATSTEASAVGAT